MMAGQACMADGNCASGKIVHRIYGTILDPGTNGGMAKIQFDDGTVVSREKRNIAVFIQAPANWVQLYERQEITCERKGYIKA